MGDIRDDIGKLMSNKVTRQDIVKGHIPAHIQVQQRLEKEVGGYKSPKDVRDDSYVEGHPKQEWHSHDFDEDEGVVTDHVKGRKSVLRRQRPAELGGQSPFDSESPKHEAVDASKKVSARPPKFINRGQKYLHTGSETNKGTDKVSLDVLKAACLHKRAH